VLALQLAREMEHQHLTKTQMARRMHTSRSSLERLLDPRNESVTLQTLDKAARSLGRRIAVALV
jgi:transcriptional regulator with XRE-family HTH domain